MRTLRREPRTVALAETDRIEHLNAVMARVASGDNAAYAELYDSLSGPIFGTVRRILKSYAMAEEVTHDVFLELWQKAALWDSARGSAAAFAITMARRRAIDRVRSEESSRRRDETIGRAEFALPSDDVEDRVIAGENRAEATELLGRLSEIQREVIDLSYFGGMTHQAISERLGLPLGTVKSRLHSALTAMRAQRGSPS